MISDYVLQPEMIFSVLVIVLSMIGFLVADVIRSLISNWRTMAPVASSRADATSQANMI